MTVLFVMPRFHIEMLVLLKFLPFFGITVFSAYDPQGDLTKMLGQRKPHDLSLTLANAMNDVVSGTMPRDHPEIMHHHEGFDFVAGNRSLSAVEVGLVNVMSRETVLRQPMNVGITHWSCRPCGWQWRCPAPPTRSGWYS